MNNSRHTLAKYRYLIIASGAIAVAVAALLLMQYRAVMRTREHARKTMKANLELHLFEISEEAKRGILDHANHIMHGVRQARVRTRNIRSIELAFTRLARRYPEVEDFYVVFFERGRPSETWRALKFVRPDPNDPDVERYDGVPVGRLIDDAPTSDSLRRAWESIEKEAHTTLYAAYDPEIINGILEQYFFHTVFEVDRLRRDTPLENIGLLVFSADADQFPSRDYLGKLAAKHRNRDKEVNGLVGRLDYTIRMESGTETRELASNDRPVTASLTRRFDAADRIFPNLTFGVASPDLVDMAYSEEYVRWSILLGLGAAMLAIVGLALTWRATRREMQVAQLKTDFLANISHELKTPLTAIRAFGDLLHSGRASNPERVRDYGGIIKTESDRLTALINNILELSLFERGLRRYRLEPGDLRSTVADTVEVFRHSPEAAEFDIAVKLPDKVVNIEYDSSAIRQAILNLLSNAAKYTQDGDKARIEVNLIYGSREVIIEVKDFGVGIETQELPDIFTPFHRSKNGEIQAKGGTGLGLSIVRETARGHGGDVSVESRLGKGSIFRLHLPRLDEETEVHLEEVDDGSYPGNRRRAERGYRVAR